MTKPPDSTEAETALAITRDQLLEHDIDPEQALATTCKCRVVDPADWRVLTRLDRFLDLLDVTEDASTE